MEKRFPWNRSSITPFAMAFLFSLTDQHLISFGKLGPYEWLRSTKLAFPAIMILSIWQGVGFQMVAFLAGLQDIPVELDEAAIVDGASRARIYRMVTVPLSRPAFASVAILQSIFRWGEFLWPLMVTRGEKVRPLPVAIQQFFSQDPKMWGDIFAFSTMITLPVLILFLLFQKCFVRSVASSGIKG